MRLFRLCHDYTTGPRRLQLTSMVTIYMAILEIYLAKTGSLLLLVFIIIGDSMITITPV